MDNIQNFFERLVRENIKILSDNLVGIYLHGSAAMGCFNPQKSDIDIITVVKDELTDDVKINFMDMVIDFNNEAPAKGLEISIVKEAVCNPFIYPTPFELHFSNMHLDWYMKNPTDYVKKMKGTDKDLAAHFKIIYHRGRTLYGKEIKDVFCDISEEYYKDSILNDIINAIEEILDNPVYIILNLCRVLAYVQEKFILSKEEGAEWGILNLPGKYRNLIRAALDEYKNNINMHVNKELALEYAKYMLSCIYKCC
ncbi:streptomycin 3'-adenylyltransferase [Herbinix hemicellulosilytica]|uniref:Streptomycin 3'-adenylyltransferase n=1 Tax=Herbinix hemicellulosilytica TaxID=1564487 RepID=A0A0H5SF62_HERHM|nr:aminoglycoside adenylyltransferase domain-containing protein [Herbinix hemicellulosilytica]RBP58347.1 streptomycin 3'-adenylyltransferase [Herbinix hemicellulosilytica]CRZ34064.1 hypothetical protein HHT355_0861 [Herbinix hemicellulosilytica]